MPPFARPLDVGATGQRAGHGARVVSTTHHPHSDGSVPGWEKLWAYTRKVSIPFGPGALLVAQGRAKVDGIIPPIHILNLLHTHSGHPAASLPLLRAGQERRPGIALKKRGSSAPKTSPLPPGLFTHRRSGRWPHGLRSLSGPVSRALLSRRMLTFRTSPVHSLTTACA